MSSQDMETSGLPIDGKELQDSYLAMLLGKTAVWILTHSSVLSSDEAKSIVQRKRSPANAFSVLVFAVEMDSCAIPPISHRT